MRISSLIFSLSAMGLFLTVAGSVAAQDTNFSTGPQYLVTQGSPLFARPISTPSISLETQMQQPAEHDAGGKPLVETGIPPAQAQSDQQPPVKFSSLYYGTSVASSVPQPVPESELEPTFPQQTSKRIFESGVAELLDPQALRRLERGASLAEEVSRWKNLKITSPHTYTNEDIERLRQGN
jgi:hypothetical protein